VLHDFDSLLTAARAGADWAWERIYRDLAPTVTGYVRSHGAAEPDDVAGEVFVQVVRDLHRFTGGEQDFRAWVFTIAHRRLVDDLRRRGRRPVSPSEPDLLAETAGAGGDVHEDATASLDEARVRAAIDELPEDQRAVLLLRILGDLTIEEIARALGKRTGAVKALQRRALKRLQGAYPFEDTGR
jgi:RNA polymerase sigma-70 factor (ECF subfamily)